MQTNELTPKQILEQNGVFIIRNPDNKYEKNWYLEYNGKIVLRPATHKIYQFLIDQFGVEIPFFKDWR